MKLRPPRATRTYTLCPYTTLFRSCSITSKSLPLFVMRCLAQINFLHTLVGRDFSRRAFCQDLAAHQDRDAFGKTKHQAHVVLDDHHSSEEHTSELQSLMRISYAVFCLKKHILPSHTSTIYPP